VPSDRVRNALQMPSVVKSCGSRRDDDLRYANVQTVCVHDADISARNLAVCRARSRAPACADVWLAGNMSREDQSEGAMRIKIPAVCEPGT
jgi:hypothetical protein